MTPIDANIKCTVEMEQKNTLAYLDTCICLNDGGATKVKVYWKATHTVQYLNWESHHSLEHKRSMVRTLLQRAESLVSEKEDKTKEVEHIKKVLKMYGYKPWIFSTMQPERNQKKVNTREIKRRQHAIGQPYISKLSEPLARVFKSYDIPVYHKPINTLRSLLVHSIDKTDKAESVGWYTTSNARTVTNTTQRNQRDHWAHELMNTYRVANPYWQ